MKSAKYTLPKEIKRMIDVMGDENQWLILEFLLNNYNIQKYSEIMDALDIPKETLDYNLKKLQMSGWLRKWHHAAPKMTDDLPSFYEISGFGLRLLEGAVACTIPSTYDNDLKWFTGTSSKTLKKN